MTPEEIQDRIELSPALALLRNKLQSEIEFNSAPWAEFSPFLVLSVISVIIQVIQYCNEKRDTADVRLDIRDLRNLGPLKTAMLRRRLNALWRESCHGDEMLESKNPLLEAVYNLSDSADDETVDALLRLGERHKPPGA